MNGAEAVRVTSETDLVPAARAGDARALDALVSRYEPRVYRFSFRLTGNADDAAEVAQDTLLAMARSLGSFRGEATLATWLYSVARRLAIRKSKQRARRRGTETSIDELDDASSVLRSAAPTPEDLTAARERDAAVNGALGRLSAAHREVLLLRDVEGLTAPEVGAVLGVGIRAVKSRLHRARLSLRKELAPLVGGNAAAERVKPGCRHVVERFSRSLEGELPRSTCAELEAHLARCPTCRQACASLKKALAVCRRAPARDMPEALKRALRSAVRQAASG